MTAQPLPDQIELHRDRMWRRDEDLRVESAIDAERFIEDVGFANTLTDTRRAGPSLYIAVCSMFVAPRLISHFAAVWMPRWKDEPQVLSEAAQRVLKVLRREHELATADLRAESGFANRFEEVARASRPWNHAQDARPTSNRAAFTRALDELQRAMKVIPQDVIYQPFSYIWMLAEDRWPEELKRRVARKTALREIARAYLAGAGMTVLGETARASGLSRVEAGQGNHQLVDEGYAVRISRGVYTLAGLSDEFSTDYPDYTDKPLVKKKHKRRKKE